jgi:hypothetical protein
MGKNTALGLLLLAVMLTTGCATTKVKDTWKKPGFSGKVHKVYLIGVTRNDKLRKNFEDEFARQLAAHGVIGIPSYPDLQVSGDIDREALRARLRAKGTDAVLVARITGKEQRAASYSGAEAGYTTAAPLNVYYDQYYNSSVTIVTTGPAVTSDFRVVNITANLFETESAEVVWAALTETTVNDDNREQRLREYSETIVRKLKEEGLL